MAEEIRRVAPARTGRASAQAAVASVALQVATLGVFALLSHRLDAANLGTYRQVLVVQLIAGVIAVFGMPASMLYHLGRTSPGADSQAQYSAAFIWLCVSAVGAGLLSAVFAIVASRMTLNPLLAQEAALAGVSGGLGVWVLYAGPFLISRGSTGRYLALTSAQGIVLAATTWAITAANASLHRALMAASLTALAGWVVTALLLWNAAGRTIAADYRPRLAQALRYGGPVAASGSLYTLGYQTDHFVAIRGLGPVIYAIYAAGAWQIPLGPLVQRAQADVLLPVMSAYHSREQHAEFWGEWRRLVLPWTILGAMLFWAIVPVAPDVVVAVLGDSFAGSAAVLRVYALILPLRMTAFALPLRAAGLPWLDVAASAAFGLVSFAVGSWLTPRLGLIGPATGMISGYAAWICINLAATCRVLAVPVSTVLPLRQIVASFAIAGVAAWAAYGLSVAMVPGPNALHAAAYLTTYSLLVVPGTLLLRRQWRPIV